MEISGQEAIEFLWKTLGICAVEDIGLAHPEAISIVMNAKKLFFELPTGYVGRNLITTFAAAYLAHCTKSRLTDEMLFDMLQRFEKDGPYKEMPDYALDHHTKRGREIGRDLIYFFEEAAKLINEETSLVNKEYYERIMERLKPGDK